MSSLSTGAISGSANNVSEEYNLQPGPAYSWHLSYPHLDLRDINAFSSVGNDDSPRADAASHYYQLGTLYLELQGHNSGTLPVNDDHLISTPGQYVVYPYVHKGMRLEWGNTQGTSAPVFAHFKAKIASGISANHSTNDVLSRFHQYFCQSRDDPEQSKALSRKVDLRYTNLWETFRGRSPAEFARNNGRKLLMKEYLYESTWFRNEALKTETALWVRSLYDKFHEEIVKSGTEEREFTYEMVYFNEDFKKLVKDGSSADLSAASRPLDYEGYWRELEATYGDRSYADVVRGGGVRPVLQQ
ncbi:hypothetical protein I302_100955 [Kwoniella bestiolae CBS 10118]|uniref:Uncharacterized protein n=1 Tax=Kwoniella bestiolae CBS 10118 TaxID=1296100 RepID=A0A1B9G6J0_9TREE|nr:hypothetical protein I302_04332 [Kwoniella bestiolae CBS 10118]OCF26646.1 hypothetical protein I302_04332 [Kwoniella bestiolae CBS 10118]